MAMRLVQPTNERSAWGLREGTKFGKYVQ